MQSVWESDYFDAYDKVIVPSSIYTKARDWHVAAMKGLSPVLDSGCGTGSVTLELLKAGAYVYALDPSSKPLEHLKRKCVPYKDNLTILPVKGENIPLPNNHVEGVTSMFVVYYVDDPVQYLRECCRVLKPGGRLALTGREVADFKQIAQVYEESIRQRGLSKQLEKEMSIIQEYLLSNMTNEAKHTMLADEAVFRLKEAGFRNAKIDAKHFIHWYSILAEK